MSYNTHNQSCSIRHYHFIHIRGSRPFSIIHIVTYTRESWLQSDLCTLIVYQSALVTQTRISDQTLSSVRDNYLISNTTWIIYHTLSYEPQPVRMEACKTLQKQGLRKSCRVHQRTLMLRIPLGKKDDSIPYLMCAHTFT